MTTASHQSRHYLISGRVQGVYYRLSACEQARLLGLTGWVRNITDGRVEALAVGEQSALENFELWLWQGPERARVKGVVVSAVATTVKADFIKRDTVDTPDFN